MKKILILPIFAVIALVSQAWGEYASCAADLGNTYYCQWPSGCYEINKGATDTENCQANYDNCKNDGYLYISVTNTGADEICNGTWAGEGNDPNFHEGVPIWCQWITGCQPIKHDSTLTNCKTNGSVYAGVAAADVGNNRQCKNSGTWTGEGKDPDASILGCCNWDGNGCFQVTTTTDWANCAAQYRYATCPGDEVGTCVGSPIPAPSSSSTPTTTPSSSSAAATPSSSSEADTPSSSSTDNTSSSSSEGTDPIISHNKTPVLGLNVVNFARNLRIASSKNATVFLFDIRGKQVLSQRVLSGTTTISLEKQKVGVYYAVAKSGSQKQIVKIVLK